MSTMRHDAVMRGQFSLITSEMHTKYRYNFVIIRDLCSESYNFPNLFEGMYIYFYDLFF